MHYIELPLTELVADDLLPVMEAWLANDAYCPIGSAEPVWFDIETTGLSSSSACTYMIGAVMRNEARKWTFRQWFAEGPGEEEELLRAFPKHFRRTAHCFTTTARRSIFRSCATAAGSSVWTSPGPRFPSTCTPNFAC